jgi:hypothetical protein
MPYRDARAGARIESERIDRLTEWLEVTLGTKLASFASGLSIHDLDLIAHGEARPEDEIERRLRNLYAVAWYLASGDGAGSACDWLTEPNPELENRAPAELLRDGAPPEAVWFAATPAF